MSLYIIRYKNFLYLKTSQRGLKETKIKVFVYCVHDTVRAAYMLYLMLSVSFVNKDDLQYCVNFQLYRIILC